MSMSICQVAISATHLRRTHQWYRLALGFRTAGKLRHREAEEGRTSGLPEVSLDVWCLVDAQRFSQIEMFEFQRPRMRAIPDDWRRSDIGYSTLGVHVRRFDDTLAQILATSGRLLTDPIGLPGFRRVCLFDPEGILLELVEDDSEAESGQPALREGPMLKSVSISVPDLERARRFWTETLGLQEAQAPLHSPEHEALWGLPGAQREAVTLRSGSFLVELVRYESPVGRPRHAGYLLSDQGLLNVALGTMERQSFDDVFERVHAHGYRCNAVPYTEPGVGTVVYLLDDCGISVELLCVEEAGLHEMGFVGEGDA